MPLQLIEVCLAFQRWRHWPAFIGVRDLPAIWKDGHDSIIRVRDRGYDIAVTGEILELCGVNLSNHTAARRENQHGTLLCGVRIRCSRKSVGLHSLLECPGGLAEELLEAICTNRLFIRCSVQIASRNPVRSFGWVPDVHHQLTRFMIRGKWFDARFIRPMYSDLSDGEGPCRWGKSRWCTASRRISDR